ncbi:MAG: hypothetical protein ACKVS9_19675 [Phycisphaerae bacterium]
MAFNPNTGEFLVVAMGTDDRDLGWELILSRWNPLNSTFSPWEGLTTLPESVDKPWIVRGNPNEVASLPFSQMMSMSFGQWAQTEFYIVWTDTTPTQDFGLDYLRSTDDGFTWIGGDMLRTLGNPTTRVLSSRGWPLPRVHDDGHLYVAHIESTFAQCARLIKFVRGDDRNDVSHMGEVQFADLTFENGAPLAVVLNAGADQFASRLPGWNLMSSGAGPGPGVDFAVDPTNADRLYLVYHDSVGDCDPVETPTDTDVNIYLRALTHVAGNAWSVGPQILVADDDDLVNETDQFMPQVVVDDRGHIHVIFYSDVNYPAQIDGSEPSRFDVWYAYSLDGGSNWQLSELCEYAGDPIPCVGPNPDPAIDSSLAFTDTDFLRDYIGIAAGADSVWTSFMGITDDDVGNPDKSVIYSTRISRN